MAKDIFAQFRKGSGQAPQYGSLAPVPASATAKYVQSFDERAIMSEAPPTIDGGPKGNPKRDFVPKVVDGPKLLAAYDGLANLRADNQVLVRETPTSSKSDRDMRARKLRVYRDQAGENIP